jgi:hypothetical protein
MQMDGQRVIIDDVDGDGGFIIFNFFFQILVIYKQIIHTLIRSYILVLFINIAFE